MPLVKTSDTCMRFLPYCRDGFVASLKELSLPGAGTFPSVANILQLAVTKPVHSNDSITCTPAGVNARASAYMPTFHRMLTADSNEVRQSLIYAPTNVPRSSSTPIHPLA